MAGPFLIYELYLYYMVSANTNFVVFRYPAILVPFGEVLLLFKSKLNFVGLEPIESS